MGQCVVDPYNRFIYGTLCKDHVGQFIYCCSQCTLEFSIVNELENHTHVHIKKNENIAKTDEYLSDYKFETLHTSVDQLECRNASVNNDEMVDTLADSRFIDIKCEPLISPSLFEHPTNSNDSLPSTSTTTETTEPHRPKHKSTSRAPNAINQLISIKKTSRKAKIPSKKEIILEECKMCGKSLINFNMKRHLLTHKHETPQKRIMKLEPCPVCGKNLIDYNLKRHMRIHTGELPYECFICHSSYKQMPYLRIHIRKHSGEKPFICDICGNAFNSKSSLMSHAHSHDKSFKCNQCDRAFGHLYKLKGHIARVHDKVRAYPCKICGKFFSGADGRYHHMRMHAEKKYSCRFCEKEFTHSSNRRTHEKQIHYVP